MLNNFNRIDIRDDIGMLWENFLFIVRINKQAYHKIYSNVYFWRTYDRKEIELVEERNGKPYGYEFKWKPRKVKASKLWLDTYNNAEFKVISQENYMEFLL